MFFSIIIYLQKNRNRLSRKTLTATKNANQRPKLKPQETILSSSPIKNDIDSILELEIPTENEPPAINDHDNPNNVNELSKLEQIDESVTRQYDNGAISLPILSKPRSSRSSSVATLLSPTTPLMTSNSFSWSRERVLEQQIENLRETLKDTEERLQSLRLQYDNLSQVHRTLRETNHQMQEEMDRLKIDAQHLHECANILRNELQAARKDRAEAIEIQEKLQREIETTRYDKRRITGETESNARQIMDLQRQCKEMERILARKNPDAIQILLGKCKFNKSNSKIQIFINCFIEIVIFLLFCI